MNAESAAICKNVFIDVDNPSKDSIQDTIRIRCNWCDPDQPGAIFFAGMDHEASYTDWLAIAVVHLNDKHPRKMK